ncbi:hypothetical protein HT737_05385 [Pseudomonas sp. MD195_PC81_125]|uniref:hypothetical protein n=1 Tax=Pseudomonas sp. MD195_PC81_125 TaxID=2741560 RepID=UPI0015F9FB43|nr:hypothetical protein [Pseudomonas sp. MD195_PC81_125]MBA5979538.1 hypothetical protein [Pseudomonas sp. MD195_PC81_125]
MAALEKRYPRESFTKKLERICRRLDEASIRTIAYKNFLKRPAASLIEITSLWVVGSYARGALMCGDLDLVLEYKVVDGTHPSPSSMTKTFFGTPQYARYYFGTPESSTAGVVFENAVQIWNSPGCDWRAPINSITPDPSAGRAERETDLIPLRAEQLYMAPERLQQLVAQERDGIIAWDFVEIAREDLEPVPSATVRERDRKLIRVAPMMGKKSQALVPAIIRLMARYSPFGNWDASESHRGRLRCGATVLHLGRPSLPYYPFDDEPTIEQFALIPHISAKGPNGAWIIRRGPNHPDLHALAIRHAFFLATAESPDKIQYRDHSKFWSTEILELFSSREEAEASTAEWDDGTAREIRNAKGPELISLFALVDVVEIGDQQFPVTNAGGAYFDRDKATLGDILAALPSLP